MTSNNINIRFSFVPFSGMYLYYHFNEDAEQQFKYPVHSIIFFERNTDTREIYPVMSKNINQKVEPQLLNMNLTVYQKKLILKKKKNNEDNVFLFKEDDGDYSLYIHANLIHLSGFILEKKVINVNKEPSFSRTNFILLKRWTSEIGDFTQEIAYDSQYYSKLCYETYEKIKVVHWRETSYENIKEIDDCIDLLEDLKRQLLEEYHVWKTATATLLYIYLTKKEVI